MTPTHDPLHGEDDQLWLGWKWFEYHSKQRLEVFKFYVTIYGALVAFAVGLLQSPTVYVSLILTIFSTLISIVFWQLDVRSRQLVEIGEAIISHRWNELEFPKPMNPIAAAIAVRGEGLRYKYAFVVAFVGGTLLSLVLLCVVVYAINYNINIGPIRIH